MPDEKPVEKTVEKTPAEQRRDRAFKAAYESGGMPPTEVEHRQDTLVVVGHEHSDTADPAPFEFDHSAKAAPVDHVAVAANASKVVLELDGRYHHLPPQLAAALLRLLKQASLNLNL